MWSVVVFFLFCQDSSHSGMESREMLTRQLLRLSCKATAKKALHSIFLVYIYLPPPSSFGNSSDLVSHLEVRCDTFFI